MKKFILASMFVAAASSMVASEGQPAPVADQKSAPVVEKAPKVSSEGYLAQAWAKFPDCPEVVVNAKNSVEAKMIAYPWYSAAAVVVTTVLVVKAVDYALASEDEETGF